LTLPQDRDLTKYEASKLLEEDAREAAPIFEPMEADNSAIMARVFSIADRWGAFAARPEELKGAEVRYEFETPVTIALDRLRAEQGLQAVDVVARLGELEMKVGQTEAFRRIQMAELQRDIFKGIGPASWLRDEADAAADIESDKMEQQIGKVLSAGKESGILDALMQQGAPGGQMPAPQQPLALPAPVTANGA
jgi:hypothetical protein